MSQEEKIPEEQDSAVEFPSNSAASSTGDTAAMDSRRLGSESPIDAEVVHAPDRPEIPEAAIVEASLVTAPTAQLKQVSPPPLAASLDNIAANGGAVGALVLGIWSFFGAFITNWSIINGILGVLLGLWGLTSRRRKMALIGILLCLISIFLSLIQVGELVNIYMNPVDENPI